MAENASDIEPEIGIKSAYSSEELVLLYSIARIGLESGQLGWAQTVLHGIVEVEPSHEAAWLGLSYVYLFEKDFDKAAFAARQALRINPYSSQALLYLSSIFISLGDLNAAGTHLGEISEQIEGGRVSNNEIIRLFRAQLARYQNRV